MAQENRTRLAKRLGVVAALLVVAGIIALGISDLGVTKVLHTLGAAKLGWVAIGVALMMLSLVLRAVSWHEILRAALPAVPIRWAPVIRATMIGVMGSAVFPGRVGEAARVLVFSRHLPGRARDQIALVAGTVFSQTLINLLALVILALVTFSSVPVFHGHESGLVVAATAAAAIFALVIAGPRLLALGRRSRNRRVSDLAGAIANVLALARRGLAVFRRPRHGGPAVAAQLSAWGLQWLSCYSILVALSLQHKAGLVAAAAVLLAVNVSAVLPPTPANVGVFQAACLVVLAVFGVGAGPGLAYGILLQAVEISTALVLGAPALLGEGMRWRDVRRAVEQERAAERTSYPLEDGAPRRAERGRPADRAISQPR
jgi:phosphatidyl-myo-inositol alpha-mannosyltransferase